MKETILKIFNESLNFNYKSFKEMTLTEMDLLFNSLYKAFEELLYNEYIFKTEIMPVVIEYDMEEYNGFIKNCFFNFFKTNNIETVDVIEESIVSRINKLILDIDSEMKRNDVEYEVYDWFYESFQDLLKNY